MDLRQEAHKRAVADFADFGANIRVASQGIFAANGGAAVVMFTFLATIATKAPVQFVDLPKLKVAFAWAAGCFLAGVFDAVICMLALAVAKLWWGSVWESRATTPNIYKERRRARRARWLERSAIVTLVAAALFFVVGSAIAVIGLLGKP